MKYIPNIITAIRLFGVIPLLILIAYSGVDNWYTFCLMLFLCLTDFVDGYIAREYHLVTDFGKLIDGIADKFLMIGVIAALLFKQLIPVWTLLILVRDFGSLLGGRYVMDKAGKIPDSNIYGKLKTTLYMVAFLYVVLEGSWNRFSSLLIILAILTIIPEMLYVKKKYLSKVN